MITGIIIKKYYYRQHCKKLLADGEDSAYVPTTTIYSVFDEIVQPEEGDNASGRINNARGVGVSNNELQRLYPGQPAGGIYSHQGVLYNAVGYALVMDALTHDGPGEASRIDLATECQELATDGLGLAGVLVTKGIIPVMAALILTYPHQSFNEPPITAYAA